MKKLVKKTKRVIDSKKLKLYKAGEGNNCTCGGNNCNC